MNRPKVGFNYIKDNDTVRVWAVSQYHVVFRCSDTDEMRVVTRKYFNDNFEVTNDNEVKKFRFDCQVGSPDWVPSY